MAGLWLEDGAAQQEAPEEPEVKDEATDQP
jgi:hypothetical protein